MDTLFFLLSMCLWLGSDAKAFEAYADEEEGKLAETRHMLVLKQADWGADPLDSPEDPSWQHLTTRTPGALLRCITGGSESRRERERREQIRREIEEIRRQLEASMPPSQRASGNNQRANQEPTRGAQTPRNASSRNRGTQVQDIQQVPQFSADPGWTDVYTYPQLQQLQQMQQQQLQQMQQQQTQQMQQQQTQRRSSGYNSNSRSRSQRQLTVNIPETSAVPNGQRWWRSGSLSPPPALSPTTGNPINYD